MGLETALLVGMGVNAAGTAMSAISARQSGKAEQKGYDANAQMLRTEAAARMDAGREEAALTRERARRMMAAQIAQAGAGGGDLGGSTAAVIGDSAYEAERDVQTQIRNAQIDAQGLRNQATLQTYYGKQARKAGNIRAATSLFQGISGMIPLYASYASMGGGAAQSLAGNQGLIKQSGGLSRVANSPSIGNWMQP